MRKLLSLGFFLFIPIAAEAQENYTLPAGAQHVIDLRGLTVARNRDLCVARSLPATCIQAEACTAYLVPGGASCTAAQARLAGARIWPDTTAGREEFVTFELALPGFLQAVAEKKRRDANHLCGIFWPTATTTQRNQVCTDIGLPALCDVCP